MIKVYVSNVEKSAVTPTSSKEYAQSVVGNVLTARIQTAFANAGCHVRTSIAMVFVQFATQSAQITHLWEANAKPVVNNAVTNIRKAYAQYVFSLAHTTTCWASVPFVVKRMKTIVPICNKF